jgi:hypothetical protein
VNGPEVLSKFVGETEKNVRDLFADAENEQKTRGMLPHQEKPSHIYLWNGPFSKHHSFDTGDQSDLHVIIFDEIDAICKVKFCSLYFTSSSVFFYFICLQLSQNSIFLKYNMVPDQKLRFQLSYH